VIVADAFLFRGAVVTVNVLDVAPSGTRMLAGTEPSEGFELVSVTTAPPPGAGAASVIVPMDVAPPTTLAGLSASVASADAGPGLTVNVIVFVTPP